MVLQSKGITDASMKDIAGLTNLTSLYVGNSGITDAGLKELAGLRHLALIDLYMTRVTDAGLENFAAPENLKSLTLGRLADHRRLCQVSGGTRKPATCTLHVAFPSMTR